MHSYSQIKKKASSETSCFDAYSVKTARVGAYTRGSSISSGSSNQFTHARHRADTVSCMSETRV